MNLLQAGDLPHFSTFYQYFLNARDWLEVRSASQYLIINYRFRSLYLSYYMPIVDFSTSTLTTKLGAGTGIHLWFIRH
jgi:hypothetical protein